MISLKLSQQVFKEKFKISIFLWFSLELINYVKIKLKVGEGGVYNDLFYNW